MSQVMEMHKLNSIKALILDMDGVLWRDNTPIGDLARLFNLISDIDLKVILATNNSTLNAASYMHKLRGFGVNLSPRQIVNSSQTTAYYLRKLSPEGGRVFIIGEDGLIGDLQDAGFYQTDRDPQYVVVGMDRSLTYDKLRQATLHVNQGSTLIATNPDKTFPTPEGLVPGAGSIVAALEASTGKTAYIAGKPSPEMYLYALSELRSSPHETLVVGDRLETDIAGAQKIDCATALVLSGVTDHDAANSWRPKPDLIAENLEGVINILIKIRNHPVD